MFEMFAMGFKVWNDHVHVLIVWQFLRCLRSHRSDRLLLSQMSTDCLTNEWCEMSVLGVKNTHIAGSVSLTDLIKYLMTLLHFCSVQDTSSSCDPTRAVNILTGSKPEIVLLTFFPWGCRKEAVGVSGGLDQVILDIFNFDIYNPQNSSSQTTPGSWTWNLEFVWKRKEKKIPRG